MIRAENGKRAQRSPCLPELGTGSASELDAPRPSEGARCACAASRGHEITADCSARANQSSATASTRALPEPEPPVPEAKPIKKTTYGSYCAGDCDENPIATKKAKAALKKA